MAVVHRILYRWFEVTVESLHHCSPLLIALGNLIEILLDFSREVIVHNLCEVLHQKVIHYDTDVGRQQFALV